MIVNMPVSASGHSPNSLPATTPTSCLATSSAHCEYNFLKRKFEGEANTADDNGNVKVSENNSAEYQNSNCTTPVWKKRHLQECSNDITASSCFTTVPDYNNYSAAHNETILIDSIQTENVQHEICVSTSANCTTNNNNSAINNNNNNNNNSDSNSNSNLINKTSNNNNNNNNNMTFNLITGSSSFINDLFAYDANLIVPVTTSLVSQNPNSSDSTLPAFATPSNVCVNPNYDDGANWQATDLLELDHRYNSGLQTEIAHLHPTVSLKATEETTLSVAQQNQAHTLQQQTSPQSQFLVPEKQVSRSPINNIALGRYRLQQLQQSDDQSQQIQQSMPPQANNTLADTDADFEDKNLSWLLNFKFDEFPHLSPDLGGANNNNNNLNTNVLHIGTQLRNISSPTDKSNSCSPQSSLAASTTYSGVQQTLNDYTRSPKNSTKTSKKFEELVMEVTADVDGNEMIVAETVVVENSPQRAPKKPPFTYTELIEYALEDKGELTVSGIYQWISDRFPYYKSNDDRWKNSVRHNLSINPHFRKGLKAPQGAGHLWTISSGDSAENVLAWEHKKQRLDLFFKMESLNRERLQQHQQQMQQRHSCTSPHPDCQQHQQQEQQQQQHSSFDEAAAAAATITREMLNSSSGGEEGCGQNCNNSTDNNNHRLESTHLVHELPFNDLMSDEELRKTAGQILNGIHREVEVQSVNSIISTYHDVLLDNEDYLNPIHKDVAVHESGLRSSNAAHLSGASYTHSHNTTNPQYYVTEIDPLELGIQMSHQVGAEEVLFSDEFNLNYFGYNGANDIVA